MGGREGKSKERRERSIEASPLAYFILLYSFFPPLALFLSTLHVHSTVWYEASEREREKESEATTKSIYTSKEERNISLNRRQQATTTTIIIIKFMILFVSYRFVLLPPHTLCTHTERERERASERLSNIFGFPSLYLFSIKRERKKKIFA